MAGVGLDHVTGYRFRFSFGFPRSSVTGHAADLSILSHDHTCSEAVALIPARGGSAISAPVVANYVTCCFGTLTPMARRRLTRTSKHLLSRS